MIQDNRINICFKGQGDLGNVNLTMLFNKPVFAEDIKRHIFQTSIACYILNKPNPTYDEIEKVFKHISEDERKLFQILSEKMTQKIKNGDVGITFITSICLNNNIINIPVSTPVPHYVPLYIEESQ